MNVRSIVRRIMKSFFWGGYVYPWWMLQLKWHLRKKNRIKIGFGPVTTGEHNLAERKWRIDPIVNFINQQSDRYVAGVFFKPEEMAASDVIVIVKKFNPSYFPIIEMLQKHGKKFIYDIVDNPNCGEPYDHYYRAYPGFLSCMDGFIHSSPLHAMLLKGYEKQSVLIEHPIIHSVKKNHHRRDNTVKILAHGYYENLKIIHGLEPVLREIAQETGKKIELYYHSEMVRKNTEHVKYIKWSVRNSFSTLKKMDIAVSIKQVGLLHQKTKPSTKLIAFMAAGLPMICTPTQADRMVMQHGVTGFFADNRDDWKRYLTALVMNPSLRRQIGRAARARVIDCYSVSAMSRLYLSFFDKVVSNAQAT